MAKTVWADAPPIVSCECMFRQKSAPELEHRCRVTVYEGGETEIHDMETWDTVDNLSDYEFSRALPGSRD